MITSMRKMARDYQFQTVAAPWADNMFILEKLTNTFYRLSYTWTDYVWRKQYFVTLGSGMIRKNDNGFSSLGCICFMSWHNNSHKNT